MEGQLQKIVGRNLRRYRKERDLSQEAFADYVGVHRTYMGSVERGERNLTLQSLERMADFLKIDPRELLTEPEEATRDGSTLTRESR
ncbi:putative transcriptional regulator [Mycobacteroides abscessus]|nr:putative transcriptional regulator [Mycobacteroides abscessus]